MVSEHLYCEDKRVSSVTHCLSPCLAESEGIGSQSVTERQQRKRTARVSHNSLFQLVVALCFIVVTEGDHSQDVSVSRNMKMFGFLFVLMDR